MPHKEYYKLCRYCWKGQQKYQSGMQQPKHKKYHSKRLRDLQCLDKIGKLLLNLCKFGKVMNKHYTQMQ